ncbi:MAG: glycosyltransferase [Bacteroidales bacterium]|nr:glycosyltransferase [Bacteroidales bacterium]
MKTAIVILNWNGKRYLTKFLPSILSHSNNDGYCVYIADNGSSDDSLEWLHQYQPGVKIITHDRNYGFALGYAKALQQIDSEYFVLLNSDVEVTPHWLTPVIKIMDNDKSIAACMPKIRSYENTELFEYAGAAGGFIDKFGYPFCRGRILNVIEKDHGQYNDMREIFWASGACMFLRASAYFEAGGLDADFFAHMEEIDLCWRLKRLGYKIVFSPEVTIYHVGGGTLPNNTPRKIFFNYRNSLFLLFKNLPSNQFLIILVTRLLLDCLSSLVYIAQLKIPFFWSVLKAHFAFYGSLGKLLAKRKKFKRKEKIRHPGEIFPGSILVRFFIKKQHHFNQLDF